MKVGEQRITNATQARQNVHAALGMHFEQAMCIRKSTYTKQTMYAKQLVDKPWLYKPCTLDMVAISTYENCDA